jgi:tellurite resistance protein TerC
VVESIGWIALAMAFALFVLWRHGGPATQEYLTGYLIELSLSVDNVFVWAVILTYFGVQAEHQFRVLFFGIAGAIVLRALFIFAGVALLNAVSWVLYLFGAFLLYTAWKIARHDEDETVDYEASKVLGAVRRVVPSTSELDGQRLFTRIDGKRLATPLFAVFVLIAVTDVVFAVDSIPAILAVARDQFIVVSSNAFAVLGLRSLYFLLAGMQGKFRYLNVGLGVILAFVGVKMLLSDVWHPPEWVGLAVIALTLGATMALSVQADRRAATS